MQRLALAIDDGLSLRRSAAAWRVSEREARAQALPEAASFCIVEGCRERRWQGARRCDAHHMANNARQHAAFVAKCLTAVVPTRVKRELAHAASEQGVTLSQYVATILEAVVDAQLIEGGRS